MSQVNVTINGRQFRMACEDGEEARLSRLASELDAAAARARTLEATNREVAQRLDAAIDTIRSVLTANER